MSLRSFEIRLIYLSTTIDKPLVMIEIKLKVMLVQQSLINALIWAGSMLISCWLVLGLIE